MTQSPLPDIELEIPPRPEYVGVVRHVMGAVARLGQHSPEFVENAKLAGSEACTNAVAMSGRADSSEPVLIRAELDDDRLHISVADRGVYEDGGEKEASVDFDGAYERGLSLPLLEGLVDELEISAREGGGQIIQMTLIREEDEPD